ncbi:MAG TPA: hypothetical protein VG899_14710 [Mycobacteriales bacterium]|nr:hypothetical protein [Mycobacteriales bacterium]
MHRCNGRLFDGSACNNMLLECSGCHSVGCQGDGCDSQLFMTSSACDCGASLITPQLVAAAAASAA